MSDSLEDELQLEIDRLSRHCDSYAAENAKLRAALELARPEIERLEYVESCSDDDYGPRLRQLREIKNAINAAFTNEQKP